MKIKLCFVVPRTYIFFNENAKNSKDKVGGAQKQIYNYSKELSKQANIDVHISVADFGQEDFELIDNVKLWKSFSFSDNKFKGFRNLTKVLKKIDADYYLFHSADPAVYPVSVYIKKVLKKKIIYMIAHDDETNHDNLKQNFGSATAISMKFAFKIFDKITVQSEFQKAELEKYRNIKNSYILPYIFDVANKPIMHMEKKYIFWIGRAEKWKRPEVFIDTAIKFPNEKFIMVIPAEYGKHEYQLQIKKLAEGVNNLKIIDFLPPSKVNQYFEESKMYLLTSDNEGFANTMMEAMHGECAIVSLKVNPDNIITKHKIGYVTNNNIDEFNKSFAELLENEKLRETMGKNGKSYLKQFHDKNTIIKNYIEFIKQN